MKGKLVRSIKDMHMRDPSFGLKHYKNKLRYVKDNEKLLRTTDGIKKVSQKIGFQTREHHKDLLSLDPVSPYIKTRAQINLQFRSVEE